MGSWLVFLSGCLGCITGASSVSGCAVEPLDLEAKACPCAAGWVCDPGTNRCVARREAPGEEPKQADPPLPDGGSFIRFEAEAGDIQAPLTVQADELASGGRYLVVDPAVEEAKDAPPAEGIATWAFDVPVTGTYRAWGRVQTDVPNNSFWVRVDEGRWIEWNDIEADGEWTWVDVHDEDARGGPTVLFELDAGVHTLQIAYREHETRLDEVLITDDLEYVPQVPAG